MEKKLFIVCPFSCIETFLKSRFGDDTYFITSPGAALPYNEFEYMSEIKEFVIRERIQTIYIVNDTSCRFINAIITRNKLFGLPSEKVMEELYIEHFFNEFKDQPVRHQKHKLAEINIRRQLKEITNSFISDIYPYESQLTIKGLLTSKQNKSLQEIRIENNKISYEL